MHIFLTTCTADKRSDAAPLPAVQRYRDPRIDHAVARAAEGGLRLMIFSGVYGLLDASDPIPWYDHALQSTEVEAAARALSERFVQDEIDTITALLEVRTAPGWAPYHEALSRACGVTDVSMTVLVWDPTTRTARGADGLPSR